MAYTYTAAFSLGATETGLTLSAQVVDVSGVNVGASGVGTFAEIGNGWYTWNYTSMPDDQRGAVKITSSGTVVMVLPVSPQEHEYTDVKTSTAGGGASAADIADAVWDEVLSGHSTAGTAGKVLSSISSGIGAIAHTQTITVDGSPADNVRCWVNTSDDDPTAAAIASGVTNASGEVTFYLDAGTYYLWAEKGGAVFTNPTAITVA